MPERGPRGGLSRRRGRAGYNAQALLGDFWGGVIAALIALPYGLAMARLMGLPPAMGLFTSLLTAPITAILGRNPVLIGGTASATVPFIAAAVRAQGIGGAAKVCLAAAVFMTVFCVLKRGRHIAKVPHAVVSGFSCGIGAMMVILQLRTVLGLPPDTQPSLSPIAQLFAVLPLVLKARVGSIVLGLVVIGASAMITRRWPRSPATLVGVAAAVALSLALGLQERAIGAVSVAIPPLAAFQWTPADVTEVLPSALGLAFVASVNILITSRVVEHFQGRHRPLRGSDADAELGAYGIANLLAGMFGAPLSVGIPARSLANVRCGGSTRLSNLIHALILLLITGFGASLIARIPLAALAGVTAFVGIGLMDWSTWRRLPRMRRLDASAFLATAAAVLATNAIAAVAIGCSFYVLKASYDRVARWDLLPVAGQGKIEA